MEPGRLLAAPAGLRAVRRRAVASSGRSAANCWWIGDVYALCIEVHDLIVAKCERDWELAKNAIAAGLVEMPELLSRIEGLPISYSEQEQMRGHLAVMRGGATG